MADEPEQKPPGPVPPPAPEDSRAFTETMSGELFKSEPPARPPGEGDLIAGRYRVVKQLARGGMSVVYLAEQEGLNRKVALKLMTIPPRHLEDDNRFSERFRLEAQTLAGLNHSNIVVIYDYGDTGDGGFYLAMEFIDGQRGSDLIKDGRMTPERAIDMVRQVSLGLEHAHSRGIVHRDIKMSNVMCQTDDAGRDTFKVVDFGLVKLLEADEHLTSTGVIMGSPHFMSPEQAQGKDVDHRADMYAVGVLLFAALTGRYPFTGANTASIIIGHCTEPVPALGKVVPGLELPAGLEKLMHSMLAKNPDERPRDMTEVVARLDEIVRAPVKRASATAPGQGSPALMWLAVAAALGVLIGFAAWILAPPEEVAPFEPPEEVLEARGPAPGELAGDIKAIDRDPVKVGTAEPGDEPAAEPAEPEASPEAAAEGATPAASARAEPASPTPPKGVEKPRPKPKPVAKKTKPVAKKTRSIAKKPEPVAKKTRPEPKPKKSPKAASGELRDPWAD